MAGADYIEEIVSNNAVTLVIPGRNCQHTLRDCLDAAVAILQAGSGRLQEIIFVDDGSTDSSNLLAADYPVRVLKGPGGGPGAARNIGWRAATSPIVWFIDSDCVAEPNALDLLLPYFDDPKVGGVGGSYGNMRPDSLLACLIHEEIMIRHDQMGARVNFLGGFNVAYRRDVLEKVGGFDESAFNGPGSPGAEDAELAYRICAAGLELRFERQSRVKHFHPTRTLRYLRSQRHHGYWRVFLHMAYRHTAMGDDYSNWVDHFQPPIALLMLLSFPLVFIPYVCWVSFAFAAMLLGLQFPVTAKLLARTGNIQFAAFAPIGFLRAIWRGIGLLQGAAAYAISNRKASNRGGS